jgi:cysteine-rich repeat protein
VTVAGGCLGKQVCGNGKNEWPEQCDDGNSFTEACDYGLQSCTVCDATCQSVPGALTGYCGDSTTDASYGEQCDDGNTIDGDGCSALCATESPSCTTEYTWSTVFFEDFNDGVANGWSTCTGCAGFGCPGVSNGVYRFYGDWNRGCMPVGTLAGKNGIAFEFDLHYQTPNHLVELDFGAVDKYKARFLTAEDENKAQFFVNGTVINSGAYALPATPNTVHIRVELSFGEGCSGIWIDDKLVLETTAPFVAGGGPWILGAYTNYACCGGKMASSYVDNMLVQTR